MAVGPPTEPPPAWWADPLTWVEAFALSNVAFLAVDIYLAHSVNAFAHPAEWAPFVFSIVSPVALVLAMAVGGVRPARSWREGGRRSFSRALGMAVGWGGVAVGIAGLFLHLESAFFEEQALKNLVYTAPFVAPLAYAGVGLLLLLNRMVDSRSLEWARWVVLLALGGVVGNFVLTLADHAQNGFFHPTEWLGVVASAFGVSALAAVLVVYDNRPLIGLTALVLAAQMVVGLLGFGLHLSANLDAPGESLWEQFVYGAPAFAPLLINDLALLAYLGLWALLRVDNQRAAPSRNE